MKDPFQRDRGLDKPGPARGMEAEHPLEREEEGGFQKACRDDNDQALIPFAASFLGRRRTYADIPNPGPDACLQKAPRLL